MKRIRTNKLNNIITGKASTLLAALLVLCLSAGFQTIQAEKQRVIVEPDNFPLQVDALNVAIEQNGGDVIYVLRNGATYFLEASMEYDHFLHIEAEEYPSNNPPIIRPATDMQGNSRRISTYRDDILMRGIYFYGLDDMGGKPQSQRTSGEGIHLHYQYCYLMGGNNYFWWLGATGTTLRIEDTQLANAGRHTSEQNQRFIDVRGNDTDSIIVVNSSIYNINFHLIRSGGAVIDYVYLDHVTVVNHTWSAFDLHLVRELTIKNSLFHSVNLTGVWESAELVGDSWPNYEGERYFSAGGFIGLTYYDEHYAEVEDGPRDSDRTIVIKNNNFGGLPPQEYVDLWEEFNIYDRENKPVTGRGGYPWGTDPQWSWDNPDITPEHPAWAVRDTIPLVRIKPAPMDSTLRAWASDDYPWATIENNIEESVEIVDMPDLMADYLRAIWYGDSQPRHYDRWDGIAENDMVRYYHPGPGTPVATTGPTASWFRNLAYNEDSQSFRHAENNYPVGNLNFFPELRERWGLGEVITSAEEPVEQVSSFRLVGNYPNPFNPTTNIVFELGAASEVTLEIFNVLGQRVATMDLGNMSAGQHTTNFDATGLISGVYMVRMQAGNHIQTMKMTLMK
jgi:hypothetical protein